MGQLQSYIYGHRVGPRFALVNDDRVYVLPSEILVAVFSYLSVSSKGRAAQVCRAWREIACTLSVWTGAEVSRLSWWLFDEYRRHGIRRIRSPQEPLTQKEMAAQIAAFRDLSQHHTLHYNGSWNQSGPDGTRPEVVDWQDARQTSRNGVRHGTIADRSSPQQEVDRFNIDWSNNHGMSESRQILCRGRLRSRIHRWTQILEWFGKIE